MIMQSIKPYFINLKESQEVNFTEAKIIEKLESY